MYIYIGKSKVPSHSSTIPCINIFEIKLILLLRVQYLFNLRTDGKFFNI